MKRTQNNTFTLLLLLTITHLLLTQNVFSKDIEFDEMPKLIQEIALRVIGDIPIDDVEREKDDGEIIYDVEAEDDRIKIELQITPDGTFIEKDITENISFLELPIPVQDTVYRQVGMLKIKDVDRKTELGKGLYYEVEADDMGIDIDLEIAPDGTLLDIDKSDPIELRVELTAKSKIPTLKDISPYREALVFYEYRLQKRLDGEFKGKKLRVAHWAIYDNQPQKIRKLEIGDKLELELYPYKQYKEFGSLYTSDTLELDPDIPLYHDIGQEIFEDEPVDERFDYDSIFSEKMPVFWQLKNQLKLVALGDSRCECGVKAELFYEDENLRIPVAYNLAISGGSLEVQELIVEEYLKKLPNLEWVVYQMSPRVVNRHFKKTSDRELRKSDGFKFDQRNKQTLWERSKIKNEKKTIHDIYSIPYVSAYWSERPWGWEYKNEIWQNPEKKKFKSDWEISEKRWKSLTSMISTLKKHDVKVLLYLAPLHPIMQGEPVVDDDGTTQEGYHELVDQLNRLQKKLPNLVFVDLLQGGNHDFTPEMFKDLDHLNVQGATKLTQELEEVRKRHAK
ncbi:hypothetical protein C6497_10755 [Candidatus Poribacteria bacterium]|nr:MAG: hypothetical protein C6497_10755 [Candidatus Poribacteria bacterium]